MEKHRAGGAKGGTPARHTPLPGVLRQGAAAPRRCGRRPARAGRASHRAKAASAAWAPPQRRAALAPSSPLRRSASKKVAPSPPSQAAGLPPPSRGAADTPAKAPLPCEKAPSGLSRPPQRASAPRRKGRPCPPGAAAFKRPFGAAPSQSGGLSGGKTSPA